MVNVRYSNNLLILLVIATLKEPINKALKVRTFKVCLNDENLYTNTVKYLGSFESLTGIRHVIEIDKET